MKLIIGGAYQGKLTWAVEQFGLAPDTLCDLAQGFPAGKRCYYHLEAFTRAEESAAPELFPEDAVIISREVGSGVVPMDAAERAWRERARRAAPAAVPPERDRHPYFLRPAAAAETMILRDFP